MAGKIASNNIVITSELRLQDKTVTSNGTVTPDSSYDGLGSVVVDVPVGSTINNQDRSVTQVSQSQSYQAEAGYTGIGQITVTAQTANPAFDGGGVSINGTSIT